MKNEPPIRIFPNRKREKDYKDVLDALWGFRPKEHWITLITKISSYQFRVKCNCGYELTGSESYMTAKNFDAHWFYNPVKRVSWKKEAERLQKVCDELQLKINRLRNNPETELGELLTQNRLLLFERFRLTEQLKMFFRVNGDVE